MQLGKHIIRKEEIMKDGVLVTAIWLHPDHPMSKRKEMQNILLTVKLEDRTVTQRVYIPKNEIEVPESVIQTAIDQSRKAEMI